MGRGSIFEVLQYFCFKYTNISGELMLCINFYLYCILISSVYTIYVGGKLSQGGHTSKLKMVINLFCFKFLTRNKFALIHVSMILMCNKIKTKASIFQQYFLCLVV